MIDGLRFALFGFALWVCVGVSGQQYTGMGGLVHVPSAEMDPEGEARMGVHFINKMMTPGDGFTYEGKKYHTFDYYISLTPFSWMEIGYTCTLLRDKAMREDIGGYGCKDRYFSLKLRPLKEGRWWPAIAVGGNDFLDSSSDVLHDESQLFWGNVYVAATKHIDLKGHEIGVHMAYRHYRRDYNAKWDGVVGGITYRPSFARNLRAIVEYTGDDINAGVDCLLWKHLLLQASLQRGKYFSGGICFQMNLF